MIFRYITDLPLSFFLLLHLLLPPGSLPRFSRTARTHPSATTVAPRWVASPLVYALIHYATATHYGALRTAHSACALHCTARTHYYAYAYVPRTHTRTAHCLPTTAHTPACAHCAGACTALWRTHARMHCTRTAHADMWAMHRWA